MAILTTALALLLLLSSNVESSSLNSLKARRVEDNAYGYTGEYEYFEYDLSQFSVRFEKCQYVKMYDDDLAEDEDADSPLALKHFAVFRLCPTDSCSTCESDDTVYGKYTVDVATYLQATIDYEKQVFENACNNCNDDQACDDDQSNCITCSEACSQYAAMQNAGYLDASDYIECQQVDYNPGGDDGGGAQVNIGPRCNSNGKITIGVFSDENCWEPMDDLAASTVLGAQLNYQLLSHSSSDTVNCLSCAEEDYEANEQDENDADDVNEMCEELYNSAAKCESKSGMHIGFVQMNREEKNYENQVENEFLSCTFIDSLIWNSYTETGEINVDAPQDMIVRHVTKKQAITLSMLTLAIASLAAAIYFVDKRVREVEQSHPLVLRGDPSLT